MLKVPLCVRVCVVARTCPIIVKCFTFKEYLKNIYEKKLISLKQNCVPHFLPAN